MTLGMLLNLFVLGKLNGKTCYHLILAAVIICRSYSGRLSLRPLFKALNICILVTPRFIFLARLGS